MIFRHSLRFRIVISFCLFGAALGTVYAAAVYFSLDWIDDKLVTTRLEQEIDHFSAQYLKNNHTPIPTSPHIMAYLGRATMPNHTQELVGGMTEGFHEVYIGEEEYHIAIKKLPYHDEPLYLIYEVSALEFTNKRKVMIGIVLVAGVILLIGLGFWIGLLTSRKVIAPVVHLADQVNLSDPDVISTDLSKNFYHDEVGMLAKVLEQSMQRIKTFIEREKEFNRDASHELRTPVTVIKGAMELLRNETRESGMGQRAFKRIERAVADMENIIESLLWLAREKAPMDSGQSCEAVPVVKEAVEQYRHLLKDKPVEIEFFAEVNPLLSAPPPILKIVINNLLQNAFHHMGKGKIIIHIRENQISVSDTGKGIEINDLDTIIQPHVRGGDSQGFGLGLAIVKRLCHRFGWHLDIKSEVGKGTSVHLKFKPATTRKEWVA